MGDFTITIKAVGGHGCEREIKDGGKVYGCQSMNCPDCMAREFVKHLQAKGVDVKEATLQHWPEQPGPLDNLLTGIRKGSFVILAILGLALATLAPTPALAQPLPADATGPEGDALALAIGRAMLAAQEATPRPSAAVCPTGFLASNGPGGTVVCSPPAVPLIPTSGSPATSVSAGGSGGGVVTGDGILGLGWGTLATGLGALLAFLYGLWKWTGKGRVKGTAEDVIASVWWIIERNFKDMPGPVKANLALAELYKALAGKGIPLDPSVGDKASLRWAEMSARDGIARAQAEHAAVLAKIPSAAEMAAAKANAEVATSPGSATELADKAAR